MERSTVQPAQPSECRVTQKSNATVHPGLPDKPAARRTSAQKCADDEKVKHLKEARQVAQQKTYQHIAAMQAQMIANQSEAQKD